MAIIIKNYKSELGITVREVSLEITELNYYPQSNYLSLSASVFTPEGIVLELNAISGNLQVDSALNLEEVAENAIMTKINSVKDKTPEECREHNKHAVNWIDLWEPEYLRFISDEEGYDYDEDYIEAAKILLGDE